jgi:catechol 2,3-dioxygenase-like lactoylglutathione lyase family enzyme
MKPAALLGLRTVVYEVTDLPRARAWYAALLGIEPYFEQPYYVGFNVGGFELGLHPDTTVRAEDPGRAVAYWGVASMSALWPRLLAHGAVEVSKPRDVGEGIQVATAKDPFGNLIGLIENPHFPNQA